MFTGTEWQEWGSVSVAVRTSSADGGFRVSGSRKLCPAVAAPACTDGSRAQAGDAALHGAPAPVNEKNVQKT